MYRGVALSCRRGLEEPWVSDITIFQKPFEKIIGQRRRCAAVRWLYLETSDQYLYTKAISLIQRIRGMAASVAVFLYAWVCNLAQNSTIPNSCHRRISTSLRLLALLRGSPRQLGLEMLAFTEWRRWHQLPLLTLQPKYVLSFGAFLWFTKLTKDENRFDFLYARLKSSRERTKLPTRRHFIIVYWIYSKIQKYGSRISS